MTILEEFNKAVHESDMSKTEIAWAMNMTPERLQEILDGKASFTDDQEKEMYKFVFKNNKKRSQSNG